MEKTKGRLTILSDNLVLGRGESLGEHGFAAYLETDSGNYLFDTGKGRTILHNASLYQKDLRALKKIILSHGHGDHTGGLPEVLRLHREIEVLGHPDIFLHRFRKEKDGKERYGGIPYVRSFLERLGAKFVLNEEFTAVDRGIYLTGAIPRETGFEAGDLGNRFAIREGKIVPEFVMDDQSLILGTERGLLILFGCAHAGAINIIRHAIRMTGTDRIWGLVGGTHLGFSGTDQTEKTIQALQSYPMELLCPSHCTGMTVITRLSREFEKIFRFSHVGMSFEF
jgi:7,8-dihydropterin-6-yl-methyl-4-(beta-D-ribofuranosyl)aminobenzene 5'-phosphate synthase